MATPRGGHDTEERSERRDSSLEVREAPPTSRRQLPTAARASGTSGAETVRSDLDVVVQHKGAPERTPRYNDRGLHRSLELPDDVSSCLTTRSGARAAQSSFMANLSSLLSAFETARAPEAPHEADKVAAHLEDLPPHLRSHGGREKGCCEDDEAASLPASRPDMATDGCASIAQCSTAVPTHAQAASGDRSGQHLTSRGPASTALEKARSSRSESGAVTARTSAALAKARSSRSESGAVTARTQLKPEVSDTAMATPRGGHDTEERSERRDSSLEVREAPPTSRRQLPTAARAAGRSAHPSDAAWRPEGPHPFHLRAEDGLEEEETCRSSASPSRLNFATPPATPPVGSGSTSGTAQIYVRTSDESALAGVCSSSPPRTKERGRAWSHERGLNATAASAQLYLNLDTREILTVAELDAAVLRALLRNPPVPLRLVPYHLEHHAEHHRAAAKTQLARMSPPPPPPQSPPKSIARPASSAMPSITFSGLLREKQRGWALSASAANRATHAGDALQMYVIPSPGPGPGPSPSPSPTYYTRVAPTNPIPNPNPTLRYSLGAREGGGEGGRLSATATLLSPGRLLPGQGDMDALMPPVPLPRVIAALGLQQRDACNIWCGGSRLWGHSTPDSDYDLYVVHRSADPSLRAAIKQLQSPLRIDATLLHADEWAERLRLHSPYWLVHARMHEIDVHPYSILAGARTHEIDAPLPYTGLAASIDDRTPAVGAYC